VEREKLVIDSEFQQHKDLVAIEVEVLE